MSAAARAWWTSVITPQNPTKSLGTLKPEMIHSLAKPTFYLGLGSASSKKTPAETPASGFEEEGLETQPFADRLADLDDSVTNIVAMGAHERTEGAIALTQNGAAGFSKPGDRMCWKIKVRGTNLVGGTNLAATLASTAHRV
jgi:hypothetical protein